MTKKGYATSHEWGRRHAPDAEKEAWDRVMKDNPRSYVIQLAPAMAFAQEVVVMEQAAMSSYMVEHNVVESV